MYLNQDVYRQILNGISGFHFFFHIYIKMKREAIKESTSISAEALAMMYDDCSLKTFDRYHTIFYTLHWIMAVIIILLSTLSGLASTPALVSDEVPPSYLNYISTGAGIGAAVITAIDKIANFHLIAIQCNVARSDLSYYLSKKSKMPKHTYDKIGQIKLLCFAHPRRCSLNKVVVLKT